jgi:hypothetical protein
MIANTRNVGNPPQESAEPVEIPQFRVSNALLQTPMLATLTRHRSKEQGTKRKHLSPGARLFILRILSRFSHFISDPKAPSYLIGRTTADREERPGRWTAWETQTHTANGLGVDERTVRRYLTEAIDCGIITVESRTTSAGNGTTPRTTNRYQVRLPALWFRELPQPNGHRTKTAVYSTAPAPRRKRPRKAVAPDARLDDADYDVEPPYLTPDETHGEPLEPIPDLPPEWLDSVGDVEAPGWTELSCPNRTELSANTGNREQVKKPLSGILCTSPDSESAAQRATPTDAHENQIDSDVECANWRRQTPDAPAGDAGTPAEASTRNTAPIGAVGFPGGREAVRAPQEPYVDPRLASISEHLRGRVARIQQQQKANVGRGYVRGIGYDIERANARANIQHGRKYRNAVG